MTGMRAGTVSQLGRGPRYNTKTHSRLSEATADDLGVRPFLALLCQRCKAVLADSEGNPRREVLDRQFVCPEGCRGPS